MPADTIIACQNILRCDIVKMSSLRVFIARCVVHRAFRKLILFLFTFQAAMGLLLGEVMRYQPLIPVVEARDLARVLQLVLSSPLVQSREARERLLAAARPLSSATSASCSSIATTTPAAAADAEGEVAAAILFGLPQTPWPCDRGWLDGVFHLVHCCSVHPVSGSLKFVFLLHLQRGGLPLR